MDCGQLKPHKPGKQVSEATMYIKLHLRKKSWERTNSCFPSNGLRNTTLPLYLLSFSSSVNIQKKILACFHFQNIKNISGFQTFSKCRTFLFWRVKATIPEIVLMVRLKFLPQTTLLPANIKFSKWQDHDSCSSMNQAPK